MTEPPASVAALRVAGPSSPWPVPSRGLLALFIDVDPERRWLTPLLSSSAASQQPDDPVPGESPPPADPLPHVLENPEGSRR